MSAGWAVVDVKHEDGDDDGQGDEDHSEEEVFANERDHERGGGDDFCDEQQEDGEREEDRDTQRDLLTTIWREVEDQHGQAGDEQAGDDEVYGVEERQTADDEEVGDVWVDLMAAVVLLGVVGADSIDDGPLATLPVIFQVDCVLDALQVDLGFVVSPRAEFHLAVLLVKGEEGDIDAAWALVDGRWNPAHFTCVEEVGFGHVGHRKLPVCTEGDNNINLFRCNFTTGKAVKWFHASYNSAKLIFTHFKICFKAIKTCMFAVTMTVTMNMMFYYYFYVFYIIYFNITLNEHSLVTHILDIHKT